MALYKENKEFRILSAIGIILVVAGHLGYDVFDIGGLFPYYSFHVFIFLFVSGYFYKEEAEDRIVSYIDGHQFMYHFPAWFVPVMFLLEVINVLMRKVLSLLRLNHEWLIFGLCLLAGILTVYFAIGGHVWGWYKIPGRLLFLFPGFQMGRIYREKLELHDRMEDGPYHSLFIPEAGLYRPSYLCGHDAPYGLLYAGEGILLPDEPMDAFLRRV